MDWSAIVADIRDRFELTLDPATARPVGGGCINRCWDIPGAGARWFLKTNAADKAAMFTAEARGLAALGEAGPLRVPAVIGSGCAGNTAYLLLEWIPLGAVSRDIEAEFGAGLARLHRTTSARFGFDADNFIGSTAQPNEWRASWCEFFAQQRLGFQLDLARENGLGARLQKAGERLLQVLPQLFAQHAPQPSLLHGDLWGGNRACDEQGRPVIFDPAVYFGDREADLAMTRLFGGFGSDFYAAYENEWPLPPGASGRVDLYNLYHVLNHANLFGGAYRDQALAIMRRLLSSHQ